MYGRRDDRVCCPWINTGLWAVAAENNVRAIFVGHDHFNDYGGYMHDINPELAYCRKTGFGFDGPDSDLVRGGRVITLEEKYLGGENQEWKVELKHEIV